MSAKKIIFISAILILLSIPFMALAYLPYLEENKTQIIISNPETSQAHYGWLMVHPYFIRFLHLNLFIYILI